MEKILQHVFLLEVLNECLLFHQYLRKRGILEKYRGESDKKMIETALCSRKDSKTKVVYLLRGEKMT